MSDALELLPPFQWRGVKYPVLSRSVSFAHETVQHKFQYRDGAFIEQTGARNTTFTYTLAMRQDIARGPYVNLFSVGLPQLWKDVKNRAEGELTDPIYGHFICVPSSYTDDSDNNKRDGTDVKVEFTESPQDAPQDIQPPTLQGIASDGAALEQEIQKVNWHQEPSPEGTTDVLSAINGVITMPERAINKVSATLNDYAAKLEKIDDSIDRVTDPRNWPVKRDVRRMLDSVYRTVSVGETPAQKRRTVTTRFPMTISALAKSLGMSTSQLLILNPSLATSPTVPKGTVVRVPARV